MELLDVNWFSCNPCLWDFNLRTLLTVVEFDFLTCDYIV